MRFLSESGYPGFKDLQDFYLGVLMMIERFFCQNQDGFEDLQDFYLDVLMMIERFFLSESGYPGFEDLQDFYWDFLMMIERFFVRIRISRM
jgi:hypothetical protein